MSVDYAAKARSADRMIRKFGAPAVLTSTTSTYDPATGSASGTSTTQAVPAVVFDYPAGMIDGTTIRAGDKQAFVSTVGVTPPKAADSFTWGSLVHKVVTVKPLAPALVNVLYELQLRA